MWLHLVPYCLKSDGLKVGNPCDKGPNFKITKQSGENIPAMVSRKTNANIKPPFIVNTGLIDSQSFYEPGRIFLSDSDRMANMILL